MNQEVLRGQTASTTLVVIPQELWQGMQADLGEIKTLLEKRTGEEVENEWLESSKVRKMLGVSPKTWQSYRDRRIIPFSQIGRKILVRKTDVEAFLKKHHISATD